MAGINKENFGYMCPLVKKYGFTIKPISVENGQIIISNDSWETASVYDVSKGTQAKPLTASNMAWTIRTNVCTHLSNCKHYDHGMETGWQGKVSKGKCMPTVDETSNVATLEIDLSS